MANIRCKKCGNEFPAGTKFCTVCGAKIKKPFYKKWWVWVLAVVFIVFPIIGMLGSGETSENNFSENPSDNIAVEDRSSDSEETSSMISEEEPAKDNLTTGQKNALKSAKNYLSFMAFSYDGLIKQLEFEQYAHEDAVFAADNCGADWSEQALKSAKNYLSFSAFSYNGLIKQLEFEKYTTEQATYAADNCGADWNEQAAKSAKNYLSTMSFSKDGLISRLEFEGFTHEQAVYGAEANGY